MRAINEAPRPTNVTELKAYLGLLSYYARFLKGVSTALGPLHQLFHKDCKWQWTNTEDESFQKSKELLLSTQLSVHYDATRSLVLSCDASAYGIGAVLAQVMEDGAEKPVAFASRSRTTQKRGTVSSYDYSIHFKPGARHCNADALSRLPLPDKPKQVIIPGDTILLMETLNNSPTSSVDIARWTRREPLLSQVYKFTLDGWPQKWATELQPYALRRYELSAHQGCILWGTRVVVPPTGRKVVLKELHDGHPGVSKVKALSRACLVA